MGDKAKYSIINRIHVDKMMSRILLDKSIRDILACPYCKTAIEIGEGNEDNNVYCQMCDAVFPVHTNGAIDFRIIPPIYAQRLLHHYWVNGIKSYLKWIKTLPDSIEFYRVLMPQRCFCLIMPIYDYSRKKTSMKRSPSKSTKRLKVRIRYTLNEF